MCIFKIIYKVIAQNIFLSPKAFFFFFFAFRERKGGREGERNIDWLPPVLAGPRIELTPFWCVGLCSNHLGHTIQGNTKLFKKENLIIEKGYTYDIHMKPEYLFWEKITWLSFIF